MAGRAARARYAVAPLAPDAPVSDILLLERGAGPTADLDTVLSKARGEHPGLPVFLLAHSWGSLVALDYVVTRGESGLTGLVLSGSAVDPSVGTAVERAVAPLLSRVAPNLGVSPLDATHVSRDQAVVDAYVADPLNYHGKIRARTGAESLKAVARVTAGLGKGDLHL